MKLLAIGMIVTLAFVGLVTILPEASAYPCSETLVGHDCETLYGVCTYAVGGLCVYSDGGQHING